MGISSLDTAMTRYSALVQIKIDVFINKFIWSKSNFGGKYNEIYSKASSN